MSGWENLVLVMVGCNMAIWTVEYYGFLLRWVRFWMENGLMLLSECAHSVYLRNGRLKIEGGVEVKLFDLLQIA